jgi:hypothetical protein
MPSGRQIVETASSKELTMTTQPLIRALLVGGPIHFDRHEIDAFPAGDQLAVADVNADGRPDVIAPRLSTKC